MAAKNENRSYVELKCPNCGNFIRKVEKNKKNTPDRLELNKFCPKCRKHTTFKEKK